MMLIHLFSLIIVLVIQDCLGVHRSENNNECTKVCMKTSTCIRRLGFNNKIICEDITPLHQTKCVLSCEKSQSTDHLSFSTDPRSGLEVINNEVNPQLNKNQLDEDNNGDYEEEKRSISINIPECLNVLKYLIKRIVKMIFERYPSEESDNDAEILLYNQASKIDSNNYPRNYFTNLLDIYRDRIIEQRSTVHEKNRISKKVKRQLFGGFGGKVHSNLGGDIGGGIGAGAGARGSAGAGLDTGGHGYGGGYGPGGGLGVGGNAGGDVGAGLGAHAGTGGSIGGEFGAGAGFGQLPNLGGAAPGSLAQYFG